MNNFFGDKALELIREHHRNKDATLAPYNVVFFILNENKLILVIIHT